jgi:hypothetical protein
MNYKQPCLGFTIFDSGSVKMNIKRKMRRGGLCRCELSGLLRRLSSILSDNIPPPPRF